MTMKVFSLMGNLPTMSRAEAVFQKPLEHGTLENGTISFGIFTQFNVG